jgi:hypothetical protein
MEGLAVARDQILEVRALGGLRTPGTISLPGGSGIQFAPDSPLEGDGFEPSVPRVMDDDDLGRQVPALIAVFELAGTAVTLQRGTKVIRPDRYPEFP